MSQAKKKEPQVCEAFHLIGKLAFVLGVRNINTLPGCWEHAVDDQWTIAVNGHRESVKTSQGIDVHPFNCWVEFNGWPAGYLDPMGGIIAGGEAANERTFLKALKAAIAKAEGPPPPTPEGEG